MCLAVPAKILERNGDEALIDMHGNRMKVSVQITPEAKVGDWLLVHAGFAIQILDEKEAEETWAILADLQEASEESIRPKAGA
ncbi:MAG: HypC/HybG/HupF family hydrogenase formation chaperone [Spirochaetes bacterium]|nr:HypC/HybG/HupF family hydrogenase formation chaperone [Spirochaetota bacterium]